VADTADGLRRPLRGGVVGSGGPTLAPGCGRAGGCTRPGAGRGCGIGHKSSLRRRGADVRNEFSGGREGGVRPSLSYDSRLS